MTNRPSSGPQRDYRTSDAEIGASLVGLADLPVIGYGEISWAAQSTGKSVEDLTKPAWPHALSAILAAGGLSVENSLTYCGKNPDSWLREDLLHLQNSTITVFEDTPAGLMAIQRAGDLLNKIGIQVTGSKNRNS